MTHLSEALRQFVIERANGCCEYCRIHQDDVLFTHHIDHIIAEKHHGSTTVDNLCLCCARCNLYKGSDIASIDLETYELTRLYHPRQDSWADHFQIEGLYIVPLTAIGRVTESLLDMNGEAQIVRRNGLPQGHFPCN